MRHHRHKICDGRRRYTHVPSDERIEGAPIRIPALGLPGGSMRVNSESASLTCHE